MELTESILRRRSVRSYSPHDIPEELLLHLVDAARWAPSWANRQTTRFVAVRDPRQREQLRRCVPEHNPAQRGLAQAPITFVVCGLRGRSGYHQGEPCNALGDYLLFDAGLAVQNFILRAAELGLGTCLVGVFDTARVAATLALPPEVVPIALSPLGYPTGSPGPAPRRLPVEELLHFEAWTPRGLSAGARPHAATPPQAAPAPTRRAVPGTPPAAAAPADASPSPTPNPASESPSPADEP